KLKLPVACLGNPDADREIDRLAVPVDTRRRDAGADSFGQFETMREVGHGQHQREFLAADPSERIGDADELSAAAGQRTNDGIARRMAPAIVDALEVVD